MSDQTTYQSSGVNRDLADGFVSHISKLVESTLNKKVVSGVGGYASLYQMSRNELIAASTDGVGTKLKLAFELGKHDSIGIDLVAMSVNDLICVGARPLFFLDYYATSKLEMSISTQIIEGIVKGCKDAECALVGGETAELPGFYQAGEYDLAGFAVGLVSKKDVLPKTKVRAGDVILGLPSSGFHSNGYSLLRRLAADESSELKQKLLTPTTIYVKSLLPLIEKNLISGLAHITGSGFLNIPRISDQVSYEITLPDPDQLASVFQWLDQKTRMDFDEKCQTFNQGIGMVMVVSEKNMKKILAHFKKRKEKCFVLGTVEKKKKKSVSTVRVFSHDQKESALLEYV